MAKYDIALFDFDGTLADTSQGVFKSIIYALNADGKPAPDTDTLRKFIGPPIYASFKETMGYKDEAKIEWMIKKYRERYSVLGLFEAEFYPGIEELLIKLRENGVKIATASSKPKKFIYRILEETGFAKYFDYIGGTDFDQKESGKTEIILGALDFFNCTDRSKAVMIGDRKFDIEGAKGAGVETVAVLYGFGSREEFEEYGAEYIAQDTADIEKIILGV